MESHPRLFSVKLGKELGWVLTGQALAAVGGFIGVRWMTRTMTPGAYGELALALTGATLVQQCIGGPISQAALRYFAPAFESARLDHYVASIRNMLLRSTGLALAFCVSVYLVLCSLHRAPSLSVVSLGLLFSALYGCNLVAEAVQSGARRRAVVAFHQSLAQWLKPVLAVGFMLWRGGSAGVALCGYVLATVTVLGSQLAWLWSTLRPAQSRSAETAKSHAVADALDSAMTRYAWPFASWGFLCWVQMSSDRWFLDWFRGAESVAAFSVCFQVGYYPVLLLATAINSLMTPLLFQVGGDGKDPARVKQAALMIRKQTMGLMLFTFAAAALAYPLRFSIMRTLAAPSYTAYASYLPLMILAGGLFSVGQSASMVFLVGAQPGALVRIKTATAVLGTLLNGILIYYAGVAGAAISSLAFGLVYCVSVLVCVRATSAFQSRGAGTLSVPQSADLTFQTQ